ncbi:hypothetical protein QSH39_014815 [Xanthomonas arboricola pv. corylina]|uniref:hypothetical protein n=1 Tax=Xanthomonas arboricola TaxID=56448 RepID=UPI0025B254AD|nr:hypothetical protein [Xanthomonas arboricola]MDN0202807.1 hypothetical protein [Xanthomonas arboricola pv. corylina]MDN0215360.1 hypothetical protein [Xanthomonas arboricola pv. corylina]
MEDDEKRFKDRFARPFGDLAVNGVINYLKTSAELAGIAGLFQLIAKKYGSPHATVAMAIFVLALYVYVSSGITLVVMRLTDAPKKRATQKYLFFSTLAGSVLIAWLIHMQFLVPIVAAISEQIGGSS